MKDPYSRIINPKKLTKKHPQSGSTSNRLTTNTAIKDQTILRRFLLDKKNGSKSQITQESQLKHNKSCEEGIWGTHSSNTAPIFNEFNKTRISNFTSTRRNKVRSVKRSNNIKKNIHLNSNNSNNNIISKNVITEIISRSNYKGLISSNNSVHNNDLSTSASLIKKLDEKYKTIEEGIIDKNFEKNIDNDEMIVTKKTFYDLASKEDIQIPGVMNHSISFECMNSNCDSNDECNECILDKFISIKNDFELIYTNSYAENVREDLLKLEVMLVIEKLFEIQNEFHLMLDALRKEYSMIKCNFKEAAMKYIAIKKQHFYLQQQKEKIQFLNSLNTFVNNHKIKHDKEVVRINMEECALWKKIVDNGENVKHTKNNLLFKLFDKIVLNNKKNMFVLSDIERTICDKINKKYNSVNKKKMQIQKQSNSQKNINHDNKNTYKYNNYNNNNNNNHSSTHTSLSIKNYRTKLKK